MSTFQIADGHDVPESLVDMNPQPLSQGIDFPASRIYGSGGGIFPDGEAMCTLYFDFLDQTELNTFETQAGLSDTVLYNDVTVKLKKNDGTWGNFNARIERARPRRVTPVPVPPFGQTQYVLHKIEAI